MSHIQWMYKRVGREDFCKKSSVRDLQSAFGVLTNHFATLYDLTGDALQNELNFVLEHVFTSALATAITTKKTGFKDYNGRLSEYIEKGEAASLIIRDDKLPIPKHSALTWMSCCALAYATLHYDDDDDDPYAERTNNFDYMADFLEIQEDECNRLRKKRVRETNED